MLALTAAALGTWWYRRRERRRARVDGAGVGES
jgi:hypothetical protein